MTECVVLLFLWGPVWVILIPTLAGLTAKVASLDLTPEDHRREPTGVTRFVIHRHQSVIGDVQTYHVSRLKNAHPSARGQTKSLVDVLYRANALFNHAHGLQGRRIIDAID